MERFVCSSCGYTLEKEESPKRCPYCSKEGAMIREKSAEELISQA